MKDEHYKFRKDSPERHFSLLSLMEDREVCVPDSTNNRIDLLQKFDWRGIDQVFSEQEMFRRFTE